MMSWPMIPDDIAAELEQIARKVRQGAYHSGDGPEWRSDGQLDFEGDVDEALDHICNHNRIFKWSPKQ